MDYDLLISALGKGWMTEYGDDDERITKQLCTTPHRRVGNWSSIYQVSLVPTYILGLIRSGQ